MHFASELFESHPRYIQVKSLMMDFFNAEVIDTICLPGLEHVISVSLAPTPPSLNNASAGETSTEDVKTLPKIHLRTYNIRLLSSGTRVPRVELTPMGPFLDLSLRRHEPPDSELWKAAMRRPKLKKKDVEKGLGKKKKNFEVDEMGDLRGKVHVAKQDLGRLQMRKMKGLKRKYEEGGEVSDGDGEDNDAQKRKKK
jgi:ribosome production factor 2